MMSYNWFSVSTCNVLKNSSQTNCVSHVQCYLEAELPRVRNNSSGNISEILMKQKLDI